MLRFHNNILFDSTQNVTNSSTASIVISGGLSILLDSLFSGNMSIGNKLYVTNNIYNTNVTVTSLRINSISSNNTLITNLTTTNILNTNLSNTNILVSNSTITNLRSTNTNLTNLLATNISTTSLTCDFLTSNTNVCFGNVISNVSFKSITTDTVGCLTTTPTLVYSMTNSIQRGYISVISGATGAGRPKVLGFYNLYTSFGGLSIVTLVSSATLSLSVTNTTGIFATLSTAGTLYINVTNI